MRRIKERGVAESQVNDCCDEATHYDPQLAARAWGGEGLIVVWDRLKGGQNWWHKERSQSLTAACHGPRSPAPRKGQIPGHWKSAPSGSRGGAPIWVMREAFVPDFSEKRKRKGGKWFGTARCNKCGGSDHRSSQHEASQDVDGFAVYGRFPKGWLDSVITQQLLGADVRRDDILHICSGTLGPDEKWTVDIRPEARPCVVAEGTALPFQDGAFKAVLLDPPYSDEYARNLYNTENPRPSWLLKEAARVVRPGGRIGLLHVAIPFAPPDCRLVKVCGVTTGVGFRIRAFTVFERHQESLFT